MKKQDFNNFYKDYLRAHKNPTNRKLHFMATGFTMFIFGAAITSGQYWIAIPGFVAGYLIAWSGHWLFEKNKPMSFTHPVYAVLADFKLFFDLLTQKEKFRE